MGYPGQIFKIDAGVDLNIAQRVEILDRDIEFFCKELSGIRHDRSTAREEQALGSRATLLAPVELHGLIHLDVQASHELARNLGDRGLVRILRFLVCASQTDETLFDFQLFSGVELELRFVGKILSDGIGAEVDAAGENLAFFEEQQVASLSSDIQEHRAVFNVAVVIAESIAQGSRRNVGELK